MIIPCNEEHRQELMAYLNQDRVINLFIIGDIENFGFTTAFLHVYMSKETSIQAVYLFWRDSLVLCSYSGQLDLAFITAKLKEHGTRVISGTAKIIDQLKDLPAVKREDCYFAKMTKANQMVKTAGADSPAYDQLPLIAATQALIFGQTGNELESLQVAFKTKTGRSVAVFKDNLAVSIASATAECDGMAMVVGVGTLPAYRNRRYASMCITKLSNELLAEGKIPCLFYNNPSAGRIYKALGYEDIGLWSMLKLK
ncbi:MAG: GNAT family N-acetyltransferase [Erysipelotrichaceae bacterium]|nr:GNAT family N-acetyltransferase [Erysipelotrichaceae bacterium]